MRHFTMFAFLFISFVVSGCYLSHERSRPSIWMTDGGPIVVDLNDAAPIVPDAGRAELDAGPIEPDGGPVVTPDAGTDANVPAEDAGGLGCPAVESDAGPIVIDGGPTGPWPSSGIVAYEMPPSAVVIAGNNEWNYSAKFRVAPGEYIDVVDIYLEGDSADIASIGLIDGDGLAHGLVRPLPSGENITMRVVLDVPFETTMEAPGFLQILTYSPDIVSGATASGQTVGWTRSGDTFRVGISGMDHRNAAGSVHTDFAAPIMSNEFVLRQAEPRFINLTSPEGVALINERDTLLSHIQGWAFASSSLDPIYPAAVAIGSMGMVAEIHSADGNVCDMRLYRNTVPLVWGTDYVIRRGTDEADPGACWDASDRSLIAYFTREEVLRNEGADYELHGTPHGFVCGDTVAIRFERIFDDAVVTGYLGHFGGPDGLGQVIDTSPLGSARLGIGRAANFVWSDMSESPHSATYGYSGGSRDWTNGYLVPGLDDPAAVLTTH